MPSDNRDWYRDRVRARDRYQERALFRVPHHEAQRTRRLRELRNKAWTVVLCLVAFVVAVRLLRWWLEL
jgi:hypothetical protein